MNHLENLQPQNVFRYFQEISQIPHGSYHTKEISDYLVNFAREHGLEHYQDADDNVIMIKEASAGYENARTSDRSRYTFPRQNAFRISYIS